MLSTKGLKALKEQSCSRNTLNKKENKAGAYPTDPTSICAGVNKTTRDKQKIII